MPTDSGRPHLVHRCPDCGTAVWSEYGGLTKFRFVRVGTLDEPTALPPDVHIYTRRSCPGSRCPKACRRSRPTTARRRVARESLERRKAVLA